MHQQFKNFSVRKFDPAQSHAFFHLIDNNRARLELYFAGTVGHTQTLQDAEQYCQAIRQRTQQKTYFPFIITCNKSKQYIGLVDVKNINWDVPKAEIGYFIDADYAGKGIISQALSCVLTYLEQEYKFKKLLCRANSNNLSSIGVALNNGFELEGIIRNDYKTTNNDIVDLNYYGKVYP